MIKFYVLCLYAGMRENAGKNADQNKTEYGHFLRSAIYSNKSFKSLKCWCFLWVKDMLQIMPSKLFWANIIRITSLLDNKTLCSYRYMSNNMSDVTGFERHASNLFYDVSKSWQRSSVTSKVLITVQKNLLKLILKSIPKFRKFQTIWKW